MCCCLLVEEVCVFKFKVLLWLVGLVFVIVFMLFVIGVLGIMEDMCVVLYVGVGWVLFMLVVWYLCVKFNVVVVLVEEVSGV